MSVDNPTEAYAGHLGNGVIQVRVDHPDFDSVEEFHVQTGYAEDGPYYLISNYRFTGRDGFIYGYVPGFTVYMQIRAIGVDGTVGDWVQVKAATVSKPTIVMECTGIEGSRIEAGSMFTHVKADRIFGVRAVSQINF